MAPAGRFREGAPQPDLPAFRHSRTFAAPAPFAWRDDGVALEAGNEEHPVVAQFASRMGFPAASEAAKLPVGLDADGYLPAFVPGWRNCSSSVWPRSRATQGETHYEKSLRLQDFEMS